LYIADVGGGRVLAMKVDTGAYARTAREEYPIFSSRLPSFEYSIYECSEVSVFASGLQAPSGLAMGRNSVLFVAEYTTGRLLAYHLQTQELLQAISTPQGLGIAGLAISPSLRRLVYSNMRLDTVVMVDPGVCAVTTAADTIVNPAFNASEFTALSAVAAQCTTSNTIPNASLFEQVHVDSGYADNNEAVQNDNIMDANASLLANRTDCGYAEPLNFDALLLGGYFCHTCLPEPCLDGGQCTNIQWSGYNCSNEHHITVQDAKILVNGVSMATLALTLGETYRFIINSPGYPFHFFVPDSVRHSRTARGLPSPVDVGVMRLVVDQNMGALGYGIYNRPDMGTGLPFIPATPQAQPNPSPNSVREQAGSIDTAC